MMKPGPGFLALGILLLALGGGGLLFFRRPQESPAVAPEGPRLVGEDRWRVPKRFKEEYFQDPQRVNRDIHLKPELTENQNDLRSLAIDFVDEGSPIYAAGFRNGDQILEVNGSAVGTLGRAMNLAGEVRRCDSLRVRIQRDGKPREFRVDFP